MTKKMKIKTQKVLQKLGHKYNSFAMMELASAAAADPFAKMKGLISDMIAKLLDEAAQESRKRVAGSKGLGLGQ